MAKQSKHVDVWLLDVEGDGTDKCEGDAGEAAMKLTAGFSERTLSHPKDVATWLRYTAFQPTAVKAAGVLQSGFIQRGNEIQDRILDCINNLFDSESNTTQVRGDLTDTSAVKAPLVCSALRQESAGFILCVRPFVRYSIENV